ncbi:MAG: peptidase, partial [Clostridia bacterium]|nr:peptidase [Clostridia bacterium]
RLLRMSGNEDFSLWKANGRGVDLNVNFDARFGQGVKNVRVAGAENYVGKRPFSEPETSALKNFTLKIRPDYTVSYHTKGEEIYWCFHQSPTQRERDFHLAQTLANSTGYPLKEAKGSVGGYKDWCIESLKIPAFTVETGADTLTHPLQENALADIIQKNGDSLKRLSKAYGLL